MESVPPMFVSEHKTIINIYKLLEVITMMRCRV